MNFIEVGLPHTEFVPTKKEFSPRRPIPMSGLSKRYMGLETLSKSELGSLIDRLSQPKTTPTGQESVEDTNTEAKDGPKKRKSGRFLGKGGKQEPCRAAIVMKINIKKIVYVFLANDFSI